METIPTTFDEDDLHCLSSEGIKIWGTTQETLEEQALEELEIFVEENQKSQILKSIDPITHVAEIKDHTDIEGSGNQKQCKKNNTETCKEHLTSVAQLTSAPSDALTVITKYVKLSKTSTSEAFVSADQPTSENGQPCEWYESEEENLSSESDYVPSEADFSDEDFTPEIKTTQVPRKQNKRLPKRKSGSSCFSKEVDDALEDNYKARLDSYYKSLEEELESLGLQNEQEREYKKLKGGLKVPTDIWSKLYEYQKEGVYWLWELHQRSTGGLLGDEMGLGKTVQIIVFLHSLNYSRRVSQHCRFVGTGPTIIVCPATVIYQWVKHFHEWSPEFRVVVLHKSGSHQGQKSKLIDEVNKNKCIIITTYAGILKYKGNIREYNWHYLILDEAHKIRNPSAKVSVAVKEIRTPHRIMLTGSPMQNNLSELWSLFDFTNPGMLGNLATFTEHFANPILQGGFANASPMQEATALSVASTLKNVISPFLLRRMKNDVKEHIRLPHKSEQVLFCSLTAEQRYVYKDYLMGEQVNNILGRGIKTWRSDNFMKANMLMAITALRKICNHPDLYSYDQELVETGEIKPDEKYGYHKKSGKMVVVSALLKIWKKQGHRTLLFSQGRSMIKIFEKFLGEQGYKYLRMDGSTSISSRQSLIDKFNQDNSYHVFLLTTRVGGLGVNLTGANRVIIYDPDWNPATDTQARERAWRIGQEKSVTVYRLLCAGTIEEKIYQRQVWKQLLSNKVLIDPTTNKFFKSSDLFDLFSLPDSPEANPETTNIFRESRVKIQEKIEEKKNKKKRKKKSEAIANSDSGVLTNQVEFSPDKIQAMKNLAQQIAKSMSKDPESKEKSKKNVYKLELKEERNEKLQEEQKLKQLTPQELIEHNRLKSARPEDEKMNKIDDKISKGSFEEALVQSAKSELIYRKLTSGQIKPTDSKALKCSKSDNKTENKTPTDKTSYKQNAKSRKRKHKEPSIDTSGRIDGEEVEGLVKRQINKISKRAKLSNEAQDNYILGHLFSKKGVSGVLEHELVFNGGRKPQSLKVRASADEKAAKALEAVRKSRLNNWK